MSARSRPGMQSEDATIRTLTLSTFGGLAGLALAIFILERCGLDAVAGLLAHSRAAIACVTIVHLVQLGFSALAWRAIASERDRRPGFLAYGVVRWIREGVNGLLPVAQIGGEVVAARLLSRSGVPMTRAVAGLVCDVTVELVTQIGFVVLGLFLLLSTAGTVPAGRVVCLSVGAAALVAATIVAAQWFGAARMAETLLRRMADRFGWAAVTGAGGLDGAIRDAWRRRTAVLRAVLFHSISWLVGGVEVWIALQLLGARPLSLEAATAIESLGLGLKAVGFVIPGALGIQEGGFVLLCGFYGIPADTGIALSLLKRIREVLLGAPSLVVWQAMEGRLRRSRRADPLLGTGGGT